MRGCKERGGGRVALLTCLSYFSHLLKQRTGNPVANSITAGLLEIACSCFWSMMGSRGLRLQSRPVQLSLTVDCFSFAQFWARLCQDQELTSVNTGSPQGPSLCCSDIGNLSQSLSQSVRTLKASPDLLLYSQWKHIPHSVSLTQLITGTFNTNGCSFITF